MKRLIYLISVLSLFFYCGSKQEKVEKYIEDGVEVIVNHLEPYKIKGKPSNLRLEEEFTIDTEGDEIAAIGLTNVRRGFDVDSEGNIYLFQFPSKNNNIVFKFDRNGNFVTSFVRYGQGPGEIQFCWYIRINSQDEIAITEPSKRKLFIFNKEGSLKKEVALDSNVIEALPLKTGNYLIKRRIVVLENKYHEWPLSLCNSELKEIKELDRYIRLNEFKVNTIKFPIPVLIRSISKGNIYVGYGKRGYEIWVFDLEGNLMRKIKKEYEPVTIAEEMKKELKKASKRPGSSLYKKKINFSKFWTPFQYLFTDEEGRLFVMTYEEGENPGEYIYDVFNPNGIFIDRISLGNLRNWIQWEVQYAKAKNNRLYCLREKESGYKELVVYKMRWE